MNSEPLGEPDDFVEDELERYRKRVEAGDGSAVLDAIWSVDAFALDMPDWLLRAIAEAVQRYHRDEVKTLDEAFGVRRPKGYRLNQTDARTRLGVRLDCIGLRNRGAPVDDRLFELVGARYGIGKTKAKDIYYRPHPTPTLAEHRKSPNFRQPTVESLKPELLEIFYQLRPDLATSAKLKK